MSVIELQEGKVPELQARGRYAIVAITRHGVERARALAEQMPAADLYYMEKFRCGDEGQRGIQLFQGTVRLLFPGLFPQYRGMILFISLGAVVRMIAPLLKDKKTDPGVVVVDDHGQFAISMLSGHLGGANELAREVASLTGAQPVVTTASDVQKTIPVDLLGQRFGWMWDKESEGNLTPASAAVVNGEKVAIVQESGEKNWWMHETPMQENLTIYETIAQAIAAKPAATLAITHRLLSEEEKGALTHLVVYRPKSIVLGVGCNRGTAAEEIETVIRETLNELGFAFDSVKMIATIDLKKDEDGLLQVCSNNRWDFVTYTPEELNEIPIEEPSDVVYRYTGAYGVSEPACKKAARIEKIVVTKKKSGNVTLSIGILP